MWILVYSCFYIHASYLSRARIYKVQAYSSCDKKALKPAEHVCCDFYFFFCAVYVCVIRCNILEYQFTLEPNIKIL